MRIFAFVLVAGLLMFAPEVRAEHVYPFQGKLNLMDKSFNFSVKLDQDAALNLKVERTAADLYRAVLDAQRLVTPFFEMTTEVQSVVTVHRQGEGITGLSGEFWSQYSLLNHKTVPEMRGRFDFKKGMLRLDDLSAGDFTAEGSVEMAPPHKLEAKVAFDKVDLSYFLDWLSGAEKKFVGAGEVSGQIAFNGTPGRISVKSNILSDGGYVERLPFDRMALQLTGVYPLVDLTNSSITKTNGFSFNLDGTVDLSDKENMAAQIASIKAVPLVKDNNVESEWVLKRIEDINENSTETKYFMKKDKGVGVSDNDDYEIFGVERKIGF